MNRNQSLDDPKIVVDEEEVEKLKESLPKGSFMGRPDELVKYQGFWCASSSLRNILMFQKHFQARDSDLIIASHPKTGATWLKSLLFSVVNRKNYTTYNSPLLTHNPHEIVHRIEKGKYGTEAVGHPAGPHNLDQLPSPRILHTHLPYAYLPDSIRTSKCRILYVSRNPFDTFVSQWKFYPKIIDKIAGQNFKVPSTEQMFEDCYEGRVPYGPFFDHILEYWNQSLESSNKVLFLKYEDLKTNSIFELKRLADFVGHPFSQVEENEGVINEIIELCSISNLKGLKANNDGVFDKFVEKSIYFRKGEIGDWANHFTPSMVDRLNSLMDEKFKDTGLSFKLGPE